MGHRVGQALSAILVLGFLGWLGLSARAGTRVSDVADDPAAYEIPATTAPGCREAVAWRVADVDPRFDVSREWVASVVREAIEVWGRWDGRPLFVEDDERGIPIRLEYDERQAGLAVRAAREHALEELDATLAERGAALAEARERHGVARARLEEERDALRRAVTDHNDEVARWSATRDGSPEVGARLSWAAGELEARELALRASLDTLRRDQQALEARQEELGTALVERDRRWDALSRAFPSDHLEAAVYRVAEGVTPGVGHSEIRVFTYRDRAELVWTLAHELGHALGVAHTDDAASLMRAEQLGRTGASGKPSLTAADRRALERLCAPRTSGSAPP